MIPFSSVIPVSKSSFVAFVFLCELRGYNKIPGQHDTKKSQEYIKNNKIISYSTQHILVKKAYIQGLL
jgi:hypothetical protein